MSTKDLSCLLVGEKEEFLIVMPAPCRSRSIHLHIYQCTKSHKWVRNISIKHQAIPSLALQLTLTQQCQSKPCK